MCCLMMLSIRLKQVLTGAKTANFRVSQATQMGLSSRGAFGILGEGIIPLRALNLTEEVLDEKTRGG